MIVVSDTSPIINLSVIGYLHLLPQLFGTVIIPEQVYEEIVYKGRGEPGSKEIENADWISIQKSQDQDFIEKLDKILDKGESSAIALAIELKAKYLLIDESLGREVAKKYNLHVTGLIGILFEAKKQGLITKVIPLIDRLKTEAGFWISNALLNEIIQKDKVP